MKFEIWAFGVAAILATGPAFSQLICEGNSCACDQEKAPLPNFSVASSVHVVGRLVDETGVPFEDAVIQLREPRSNTVIATVEVNRQGQFDLGVVPKGLFRLIAARRTKNGALERLPGMDQPKLMTCSAERDCAVDAVLRVHGTDLPFEFCPPQ